MVDFPTKDGFFPPGAQSTGPVRTGQRQMYDAIMQLPGVQSITTLTLATDAVTPTRGVHAIDTEAAAATDDLKWIQQTNLPDGALLLIRTADNARDVTVKHAAGGAGQILLADSADLVLAHTSMWLLLRRNGTSWEEVGRFYGSEKSAFRAFLGLGNVQNLKVKLDATAAPTVNDDTGAGYAVGSTWVDVTNDRVYQCVDASAGAAVWKETTSAFAEDAWARVNLLVNWLGDKIGHTVATGEMMDGVSDAFATDTIGATSDGETYDAAGDFYGTDVNYGADLSGSGTVSASSVNTGSASLLTDNDTVTANQWTGTPLGAANDDVSWIKIDFGAGVTKAIRKATITQGYNSDSSYAASSVAVQYSDNDSSWTDAATFTSIKNLTTNAITWGAAGTHRYWRFLCKSGVTTSFQWGLREVELMESSGAINMTLMPAPTTAQSQPSDSRLAFFHKAINAATINTDIKAYVSRDDGRTVTADAATDKLTLTAHGFANGDRVFFTNSGGALPGGSDSKRLYHVVGATTNDFQISLTAGGAAIDITSAGTGTHKVHKAAAVTLTNEGPWDANYHILSGPADVSGLPAGTRMMWIVETLNNKEQRVRGVAQMWG